MTKNERIKRLETAVYELATLLGYRIKFDGKCIIPEPLLWRVTLIEKVQALCKKLDIRIGITQPQGRPERITIKSTKEIKNAKNKA